MKKNQLEQIEANGSVKNVSKTSAGRNIYVLAISGNDATDNPFSTATPYLLQLS